MIKRQSLMKDLTEKLKEITTVNGYRTDVSNVKHFSSLIEPKANEVILNIKDVENNFEDDGKKEILTVEIIVGCIKGDNNYNYITNLIDDIYKCLYNAEKKFNTKYGYCVFIPVSDALAKEQFEREIAEAVITFNIIHNVDTQWTYQTKEY